MVKDDKGHLCNTFDRGSKVLKAIFDSSSYTVMSFIKNVTKMLAKILTSDMKAVFFK